MTKKIFEATVRYQSGAATLDLCGELTGLADDMLNVAYTTAESQNPEVIFLNFAEVDYINSTGIAVIIGLLARARHTSRTLIAYELRPFYTQLFDLAGLSEYMPILTQETDSSVPA